MNLAAIDIGTNSTLLLIADTSGDRPEPQVNRVEITRLGQGVDKSGRLHPDAMDRTFTVLADYARICREHHADPVLLGGTSALRDAENGGDFLDRVRDELGWEIRILTGDDEARITYTATRHEFDYLADNYLVMDIGGGSTEFIYGDKKAYSFAVSVNIGSVRLTEQFISQDPPSGSELEQIHGHIHSQLEKELGHLNIDPARTTLIGVAGTVTTLLAVGKQMEEYIPEQIHRQPMSFDQVKNLLSLFTSMPYEQRKELAGLQPRRADVIIAGTAILLETMDYFGFPRLLVSDRGVRYGLIYEYLESRGTGKAE